jgi:hypothetical protein
METTLFKTVKGSTMENLFNSSSLLNIRHYRPVSDMVTDANYNQDDRYAYEIVVRHPEESNAETLFQKAITIFEPVTTKNYLVSVVCSDAETHTATITCKNKSEASRFLDGMKAVLIQQGKSIFIADVKIRKEY